MLSTTQMVAIHSPRKKESSKKDKVTTIAAEKLVKPEVKKEEEEEEEDLGLSCVICIGSTGAGKSATISKW